MPEITHIPSKPFELNPANASLSRPTPSIDPSTLSFLENSNEETQPLIDSLKAALQGNSAEFQEDFAVINQEMADIQNDLDQTLNHFFTHEVRGMAVEEKIAALAEIMRAKEIEIKNRLQSKVDSLGHGKTATDILRVPFFCLVAGYGFADKVTSELGTEATEILKGSLASVPGLGVIGFGFSCFTIQSKARAIRTLEEKKSALVKLATEERNPAVKVALDNDITALTLEIQNARANLSLEIKEVTGKFLNDVFSTSHKVLDFVTTSNIVDAQSTALEQMMGVTADVSAVASLVTLGWNVYQVVQNSSHLTRTNNKIESLQKMHQALTPEDAYLSYIIQAKIERLQKVKQDYQYQISTKIVNGTASSLAVAGAAKALMLQAGVALGATTVTTLSTAGGMGLVLVITGITMAIGRGAYHNRYNIEHAAKTATIQAQKIIYKTQLELAKKSHEAVLNKFAALTGRLLENAEWRQNIQKDVDHLAKIKNPITARGVMQRLEQQNQLAESQNKQLYQDYARNIEMQELLTAKMQQLERGLDQLGKNQLQIGTDKTLKNEQKNFGKYDITTLGVVKKVLEEALSKPDQKEKIVRFLHEQGFEAKANLTLDDLITYLVSPK